MGPENKGDPPKNDSRRVVLEQHAGEGLHQLTLGRHRERDHVEN